MNACPEDFFDFLAPNYAAIFQERARRLARIKANPGQLSGLKNYYRDHIADFISQWGCTFDPRNPEIGLPTTIPFILFPKQRDWIEWALTRWRAREDGLTEKSRDSGVSWLAIAFACSLCLFNEGLVIGFGSRKEEYVDKLGQPKSLFEKARIFLGMLPKELRGGWERDTHSPYMRILFPETGSCLTGEAGDNIGRGDRTSMHFIDEAAFLERAELIEASLSATSNCRMYISTPNGRANPFAQKRFSLPQEQIFTFHWRDDPRKGDDWYAKACAKLIDPVIIAQELDIDYTASVEGIIIPQAHVQAMIDAHKKLGIEPSGVKRGALDVADQGKDLNAFASRHGQLITHCESWRGKGSFLHETTSRAYLLCDEQGLDGFDYDADGMGAGVRSDVDRINKQRIEQRLRKLKIGAHQGSAGVFNPEQKVSGTDRTAKDMFQNFKAQSWWELKRRAAETARAVLQGGEYNPDLIISIDSRIPALNKLCIELSQAQWKLSPTGKILVDKVPDGEASPNMADAIVILFAPRSRPMRNLNSALDYLEDH